MTDLPRRYITYLPPAFQQIGAADSPVIDRYLQILQALLGPADRPEPDPAATVIRKAMATVIDALPNLFYPRLSFLFPESDEPMPPLNAPSSDPDQSSDQLYRPEKMRALNNYFGLADPPATDDLDDWQNQVNAAVSSWLTGLLAWQAAWVDLTCDTTWWLDQQRDTIARILPIYRQRGTPTGLAALATIMAATPLGKIPGTPEVRIRDLAAAPAMTVGRTTRLRPSYKSGDPVVGGVRPFSFVAELVVLVAQSASREKQYAIQQALLAIRSIIDREKPAHTTFTAVVVRAVAQIGVRSTVGRDLVLPLT